MELLIPGLILVALMIYASTRIKRSAERAFEPETIETDEFTLVKPDGFLHLINGDPGFAFQAYSKEFGSEDSDNRRKATMDLRIVTDKNFGEICESAKREGNPLAERKFQFDDMKACALEIERSENGINIIDHFFMVDAPKGVYELRTGVLKEHNEEISSKINQMEESLTIKK